MHLKTLTLKGFKSFASSTTLRLEPGITAVVGPNGSGKSNVVDALTWVMGEQGAKNLRGGTMADVIFAGAGSRPALGRAEVSLTIDNSDGALPIEYTEVTVTRTLFRGGGSEYQVNGTPCRLLDVQELLSDTGLGRQMHVIVGQGRLDSVLSASPEERRGFIEEAAGVLKHRRRKERALRKLDSMAADLTRLTDLTAELHRQLGPLARQAAVARRAQVIQAEVRDATARLLADDVVQVEALLEAGDADRKALAAQRARAEEAERVARSRLAELDAVEATFSQRLAQATSTWEELTAAAQSFTALEQVAGERVRGLDAAPPAQHGTDPLELERRAEQAEAEEVALSGAVEEARTALSLATSARQDAEAEETASDHAADTLSRQLAQRRETLARAGGRVASARSRHEAALAALEQARAAVAGARRRADEAQAQLDGHAAATGRDVDGGAARQQTLAAAAHEDAAAALEAARDAVARASDARREAAADRATWTARRDTLALSLRSHDATAALADSSTPGVLGPVAEHVSVERGWENAVAALLGERATAALVEDDESARAALEHVRRQEAGAVRVVVADSAGLPPALAPGQAEDLTDAVAPHARRALDVVTSRGAGMERVLATLLARAWVVEDLAEAAALRGGMPEATVATRAGEVLAPGWAMSAGVGTSSVLELTAAYEEARTQAQAAAQEEATALDQVDAARRAEEAARERVGEALAELRAADAAAARVAEESARLASAVRAAQEEAGRAERVLARATEEAAQRTTELAAASAALAELEGRSEGASEGASEGTVEVAAGEDTAAGASTPRAGSQTELESAVEDARARRDRAAQAAREARAQETEARLTLRTAEERERSSRGRADSLRAAARRERQARAEAQRQAQRRQAARLVATCVRDQAHEVAGQVRAWAELAASQRREVEQERASAVAESAQVRRDLDEATRRLAELTDAAHRDDVARAEHRMRLEALAERAMSELGVGLEALVEEFGPHMPVPQPQEPGEEGPGAEGAHSGAHGERADAVADDGQDQDARQAPPRAERHTTGRPYVRAEQERRLARARRDLTRLGAVNPLALEEHAALSERHRFLAEQLADLTRSREDLLALIEQIDARVLEVMTAAWQDTAREFEEVFARLFPGGQGRLELTDPDDMLTTGVEIHARPAGKRVSRLSLLSGGERSLAAVALLVAIFRARPSPFYVMDEVEAALDDTNLGRLLEVLKELSRSSQLIVITHQKRTMEAADALYGVSMRQGVTQVVSQRLER